MANKSSKYYYADDFINDNFSDPIDVAINKKIELLYELLVLKRNLSTQHDDRERAVRQVLSQYTTEHQLTTALFDIVRYNITIDEWLEKRGVLACCV